MKRRALILAALFGAAALSGCAHGSAVSYEMLAKGDVALCKHCNCYMPARLSANASCPTCNCHQPAISCYEGK